MSRPPAKRPRVEAAPPDPAPDASPVVTPPKAPRKRRTKPDAEPNAGEENQSEVKEVYGTWGSRITSTHKGQLDAMMDTAPRHVTKQALVWYILTEFFRQHPELPEELRQPKPSNRAPRP